MANTTPLSVSQPSRERYDVIIVGSGMGGGTLAFALKDAGITVLLIERGGYVPQEAQNWDAEAVFAQGRYKNAEDWYDTEGRPFSPGTYYYVGGNTKFYGSSLVRFRREDFESTTHHDGESPAWPFGYDDLAPHYRRAEEVYKVHGDLDDPTLPRSEPFPFRGIGHEPPVQAVADRLRQLGYTPSTIPLGIDLRQGGSCIRCATCDGFPCRTLAKSDADVSCVRPAVASGAVELLTHTRVDRVLTDSTGRRAAGVECVIAGNRTTITAGAVVVACGAVNSAALLLRSGNEQPSAWACELLRSGRPQLHGPQQLDHGRHQPVPPQHLGVPEDVVLQRLLFAWHTGSPLPPRPRAAHRQAAGRHGEGPTAPRARCGR